LPRQSCWYIAGARTFSVRCAGGPASNNNTFTLGSSERRRASTHPDDPAPTIT
jgi:hypothetical protein